MYVLYSIMLGLILVGYGLMVFKAASDYSKGITSIRHKSIDDVRDRIRDKYYF